MPFYFHHRGPALNAALGADVPDPMVEMFVGDLTTGNSGIVAGMLKCAIDEPGLTPGVERVMRAVARAHHLTGAPITVHTHPGTQTGLLAHRVLCLEEGVDPARIVLGHSGDTTDAEHLLALADARVRARAWTASASTWRRPSRRAPTSSWSSAVSGLAGQLVLSQDASCYIDWIDPDVLAFLPQWHYLHLHDDVLPYLREAGVTEEQISTMLVDVPRRVLAG